MIPWVSVFIVTDSYLKGTNQSITLSTQIFGTVKDRLTTVGTLVRSVYILQQIFEGNKV